MPSIEIQEAAAPEFTANQAAPDIADATDIAQDIEADLEMVELELALDRQVLQEFGFEHCLQQACATSGLEFLFQLPIFDQIPGQRIAVLSAAGRQKLVFAVLNDAGTDVEILAAEDMRPEIRSFASAFMEVFTQLGSVAAAE